MSGERRGRRGEEGEEGEEEGRRGKFKTKPVWQPLHLQFLGGADGGVRTGRKKKKERKKEKNLGWGDKFFSIESVNNFDL